MNNKLFKVSVKTHGTKPSRWHIAYLEVGNQGFEIGCPYLEEDETCNLDAVAGAEHMADMLAKAINSIIDQTITIVGSVKV